MIRIIKPKHIWIVLLSGFQHYDYKFGSDLLSERGKKIIRHLILVAW